MGLRHGKGSLGWVGLIAFCAQLILFLPSLSSPHEHLDPRPLPAWGHRHLMPKWIVLSWHSH